MQAMAESDTSVISVLGGPERHDVPAGGRSGFLRIGGRQVHYLEWGRADRPCVLALHGGGQTAYMWEDLGPALAPAYHVLAPDLPHHGESDPLPNPLEFSRELLAADLPELIAQFTAEPVAVVGASLGGITALTLAAAQPALVSSIVLVDVGHRLEEEGVHRIISFMRRHESFGSLQEAADAIADYLPHRRRTDSTRLTRNLRQRADGRWVWKHGFGHLADEVLESRDWHDILAGLDADAARIQVPALVLRGAHSDVLSSEGAQEIGDLLPNAEVVEVSAAGHLAAGDNPVSTTSLIRDFLDRQHRLAASVET